MSSNEHIRTFLDDINQSWVTRDLLTGGMSANTYDDSLYDRLDQALSAIGLAHKYWQETGLIEETQ